MKEFLIKTRLSESLTRLRYGTVTSLVVSFFTLAKVNKELSALYAEIHMYSSIPFSTSGDCRAFFLSVSQYMNVVNSRLLLIRLKNKLDKRIAELERASCLDSFGNPKDTEIFRDIDLLPKCLSGRRGKEIKGALGQYVPRNGNKPPSTRFQKFAEQYYQLRDYSNRLPQNEPLFVKRVLNPLIHVLLYLSTELHNRDLETKYQKYTDLRKVMLLNTQQRVECRADEYIHLQFLWELLYTKWNGDSLMQKYERDLGKPVIHLLNKIRTGERLSGQEIISLNRLKDDYLRYVQRLHDLIESELVPNPVSAIIVWVADKAIK